VPAHTLLTIASGVTGVMHLEVNGSQALAYHHMIPARYFSTT
jgi:hypothetical protein